MTSRPVRAVAALALATTALAVALASCGPPTVGMSDAYVPPLPGTYANATAIMTRSCVFSSCHGGVGLGSGRLNLQRSITAGTLVADLMRPACEYGPMPLLTPGDPMNSWLYLKVAGPHTGDAIDFTPSPTWDHGGLMPNASGNYPVSTCPLTSRGQITFGALMPMSGSGTPALPPNDAETIRLWIAAGAPGP